MERISIALDPANLAIVEPHMVDFNARRVYQRDQIKVDFPLSSNSFGRLTARLAQSSRSPSSAKTLPLGSVVDSEGTDRRLQLRARNPPRIGRMHLMYSKYLFLCLSQLYGNDHLAN